MLAELISLLLQLVWTVLSASVSISLGQFILIGVAFVLGVVGLCWAVKKFLIALISGIRLGLRKGKGEKK